jgi:hypothetical protein
MIKRLLLALALLLAPLGAAHAQLSNAVVVGTCGTPPATYTAGQTRQITQDTTGHACTSASATGTFTNNAAGSTGSAVPGAASYDAINVGGTLRGLTGSNPTGTTYAAHVLVPDFTATGNITSTQSVTLTTPGGYGGFGVQVTGTWTGTLVIEVSVDGTNFVGTTIVPTTSNAVSSITANTVGQGNLAGFSKVRIRGNTVATGTAVVTLNATQIAPTVMFDNNAQAVQIIGAPTLGVSTFSKQVANNTTSVAVATAPATLYAVRIFNNGNTIAYLKLYDAAQGSTTCGSGTPKMREMIQANNNGGGAAVTIPVGIAFATAITACVTTGYADNDTAAPAATTYIYEIDYKQ